MPTYLLPEMPKALSSIKALFVRNQEINDHTLGKCQNYNIEGTPHNKSDNLQFILEGIIYYEYKKCQPVRVRKITLSSNRMRDMTKKYN